MLRKLAGSKNEEDNEEVKEQKEPFIEQTPIEIRIMQVEDQQLYCVEFTKLGGRWVTFNEHYQQIKEHLKD
jgi:hypothetical protein